MPDGSDATKVVKYEYDYLNRRTTKQIKATNEDGKKEKTTDRYTHLAHDIVLQSDQNSETTHRFLHYPDIVDQCLADEQLFNDNADEAINVLYPLFDNLGSTRDLVDYDPTTDESSVVNSFAYDTSGNLTYQANTPFTTTYAFAGRELDPETGQYYNRNRYYDPQLSTFISEDPISFSANDVNLYRYAGNSPTNATDPSGMDEEAPAYWESQKSYWGGMLENNWSNGVFVTKPQLTRYAKEFMPGGEVQEWVDGPGQKEGRKGDILEWH